MRYTFRFKTKYMECRFTNTRREDNRTITIRATKCPKKAISRT